MGRGVQKRDKSASNGHSLVTILFVLGIIGWGFFAIDRLTESETATKANKAQSRARGHESSWKKSVRDWLSKSVNTSVKSREVAGQSVSRNIPLEAEPRGLTRADLEIESAEPRDEISREEQLPASVTMHLYKLNSRGQPVLAAVKREFRGGEAGLSARLEQLVRGPTLKEQDKDFIDSFIRKPKVLKAGVSGQCTYIDFDAAFGAGVSYQTLRFQINQMFKNVTSWTNTKCVELRIAGRYRANLGSDGLYVPKRIDAHWLEENL